jgi:hypothetical protein
MEVINAIAVHLLSVVIEDTTGTEGYIKPIQIA